MPTLTSDGLVDLLVAPAQDGRYIAHNWQVNPFPQEAASIRVWCDDHGIAWGDPQGWPVQQAQRDERARPNSRMVAFQETGGRRRIMFALSKRADRLAFDAALRFATRNGFRLLDKTP